MELTLETRAGITFSQQLQYKQPDGTSVDLTGWTLVMKVKRDDFLHEMLVTVDDEVAGLFTVSATPEETADFPLFSPACRYDIVYTDPTGNVGILIEGDFVVREKPVSL